MAVLIFAAQLAARLNDPACVVFDCRHDLMDPGKGERLYREGHIPGARLANLDVDLSGEKTGQNGRHPLPPPAALGAFLARQGVDAGSTLVAYDDVGGQFAARLWWLARWIGLTDVRVLDGGLQKWLAEGYTLTQDNPVPRPTVWRGAPQAGWVVNAAEVQAALASPAEMTLIDARAAERYRGEVEPLDPVAGHIPGALNRFYKENLQADLTMKSAEVLRAEFTAMGTADRIVHQCGSGVTACANILAMEHAGLVGSRLYPGSWSEWVADPARPVAQGQ